MNATRKKGKVCSTLDDMQKNTKRSAMRDNLIRPTSKSKITKMKRSIGYFGKIIRRKYIKIIANSG